MPNKVSVLHNENTFATFLFLFHKHVRNKFLNPVDFRDFFYKSFSVLLRKANSKKKF